MPDCDGNRSSRWPWDTVREPILPKAAVFNSARTGLTEASEVRCIRTRRWDFTFPAIRASQSMGLRMQSCITSHRARDWPGMSGVMAAHRCAPLTGSPLTSAALKLMVVRPARRRGVLKRLQTAGTLRIHGLLTPEVIHSHTL